MTAKKILEKCKLIKLVITDVDGVLTNGGMYYSEKGKILKSSKYEFRRVRKFS